MKKIVKRILAAIMVLTIAATGMPRNTDAKTIKKQFYVSPVSDEEVNYFNWNPGLYDSNGNLYDAMIVSNHASKKKKLASYYIIKYKKNGKVTKEKLPIKKKNSVLTMTSSRWGNTDLDDYSLAIGSDGNYHIMCDAVAPDWYTHADWQKLTYYIVSKKGKVLEKIDLCNNDTLTKKIRETCAASGFEMGEHNPVYPMKAFGYKKNHLLIGGQMRCWTNPVVEEEKTKYTEYKDYYFIADYNYKTDKIDWVREVDSSFIYVLEPTSKIEKSGDSYLIVNERKNNKVQVSDIKTGEVKLDVTIDEEEGWYDTCYYDGTVYGVKDSGIYKYVTKTQKWKKVCSLSSSDLKKLHASEKLPISLRVINKKSFLLYGHEWLVEFHKKKLKVLRIDL